MLYNKMSQQSEARYAHATRSTNWWQWWVDDRRHFTRGRSGVYDRALDVYERAYGGVVLSLLTLS